MTKDRKPSQFTTPYGKTLALLEKELNYLGATNVIFQVAMRWDQIRNDGRPKAGQKASHPGVIISFDSKKVGPCSFPCDTYDSYEHNIHAIALALGALRAVDRYGVTKRAEQYKGWKALPEHSDTTRDAALLLERLTGYHEDQIIQRPDIREEAYKLACRKAHPDTGGNHEQFVKVQEAIKILRAGKATGATP
jgi:hypothetical protein